MSSKSVNALQNICHARTLLYLVMQNVSPHLFTTVQQNRLFMFLSYLDLMYNNIDTLPLNIFVVSPKLTILNLKGNNLQIIQKSSLSGLALLHTLDLSDNNIKRIYANVFDNVTALQNLYIENNPLKHLSSDQLPPHHSLTVLKSDFSVLCCFYTDACHCSPKPVTHASCTHILSLNGVQVFIIIQGITIVALNILAIVYNIRNPTVEIVQFLNVNIADLLMGLSLGKL